MAKVGYIFIATNGEEYAEDKAWMQQYGCVQVIEELSEHERLRPMWKQLISSLERGDELVQRRDRTITITGGRAQGELVGGNLTVLTALAGSPYMPDFDGKILFLEDVSEAPYRIDRMLSTLKLMGALDRISGFIWGNCTDCGPGSTFGSLTIEQILDDYIKPLGIPAYRGAQIGHIRQQFIVPVGGRVEMDADAGTFRLLEPVFQ